MVSAMAICNFASAQLYIDNATFFIQSGATVTVQGDVTSNADIQGTGKLQLKGSGLQTVSMSGKTIPFLEIDNVSNATLSTSARVADSLIFTNGSLLLGANNLTMGSNSTQGKIVNASSTKFVVTSGAGKLIKAPLGAAAYTYPVGNSTTTYNPVTLANTGTVDSIGVRCLANVLSGGTAGTAFTKEVVDASWDITESTAGGSSLSLTANWATSDQLAGFSTAKAGISNYITTPAANVGWDLLNANLLAASAGTPNSSVTRTGISTLGAFAVGYRPVLSPLLTAPKVFLQGNYAGGLNGDGLRTVTVVSGGTTDATHGVIPLTEPYTGMPGFTHSGSGGGETIASSVLAVTGNNAISDWVFVQLHRSTDSVVVSTRAALLQKNGTIVETDGVTPLSIGGNLAGNYYLSVRHRNHLGVRSSTTQAYAKTTPTAWDFTTGLNKAYTKGITNAQMANNAGAYLMWGGNANDDIKTTMLGAFTSVNDYSKLLNVLGSSINTINGTYSKQDLNLDGKVTMLGAFASVNDYSRLLNVLGSSIITVTQPTF